MYHKTFHDNIDKLNEDLTKWNKGRNAEIKHEIKFKTNTTSFFTNLTDDGQIDTNEIHGNYKSGSKRDGQNIFSRRNDITTVNNSNRTENHWPKFDDILLSIGKIYDWKNDRWIKVKARKKQLATPSSTVDSRIAFLSKHKFYYRSVKLNTSKTKKNVVIAVSAVR